MAELAGQQQLVRTHLEGVRRYLAFLGCRAEHLADLVQDTFLAALTANLPCDERAAGWLRTTARHRLLKLWRAQHRRPVGLEHAEAVWQDFSGDDDGAGWLEALRVCVGDLPARSQQALQLRYQDALPIAAMSPRLGLSVAGVESLLVRVRRLLRACVERRLA